MSHVLKDVEMLYIQINICTMHCFNGGGWCMQNNVVSHTIYLNNTILYCFLRYHLGSLESSQYQSYRY